MARPKALLKLKLFLSAYSEDEQQLLQYLVNNDVKGEEVLGLIRSGLEYQKLKDTEQLSSAVKLTPEAEDSLVAKLLNKLSASALEKGLASILPMHGQETNLTLVQNEGSAEEVGGELEKENQQEDVGVTMLKGQSFF